MKRIILAFAVSVSLFSSCANSDESYVMKLENAIKSHKSVTFKLTKKAYSASALDTIITPYEVWAFRPDNNSRKDSYVWVNDYYRPYNMIFNSGKFYLVIPPKKTTIEYTNYNEAFISENDWIDVFLSPESFSSQLVDTLNRVSVEEIDFSGVECQKIDIEFPKDKKGVSSRVTYILDRNNFVPIWSKLETTKKSITTIKELFFTEFKFDSVELDALKEKQKNIIADNPIEDKASNSETSRLEKMLHIGDDAPLFTGNNFETGDEFKLEDYIGKNIIIVDFWYTHCPPCVRAMPHLSELYSKYESKGLKIFGINSVDNQERSIPNLEKFLSKRKLSYDVILAQPSVDIRYKINGYPTMYVVGMDGKIEFIEVGFDQEKLKKITDVIEKLTSEN